MNNKIIFTNIRTNVSIPVTTIDFVSSAWSSSTTNVMVGYNDNGGAIIRTSNMGATWTLISSPSSQTTDIAHKSITQKEYFLTVATDGKILLSSNEGLTFTEKASLGVALFGVDIGGTGGNSYNAYAVGVLASSGSSNAQSKVFSSPFSSGFATWSEITPAGTSRVLFTAVTSFDGVNVIIVGYSGVIYYSSTSGGSFSLASVGTTNNFQCIGSASASYAMAAGNSGIIFLTTNGGATWTSVSAGLPSNGQAQAVRNSNFQFHAIAVVSTQITYLTSVSGYILRTFDSGTTWSLDQGYVGTAGVQLYSISMFTSQIGVVSTFRGYGVYVRNPDPSAQPTPAPSPNPTPRPTPAPTAKPSPAPTPAPSPPPTSQPTRQPSSQPTTQPSRQPSSQPSCRPTIYLYPSSRPSSSPTNMPTGFTSKQAYTYNLIFTGNKQYIYRSAVWSSADNVVAVGSQQGLQGLLLHSSDGGSSWTPTIVRITQK